MKKLISIVFCFVLLFAVRVGIAGAQTPTPTPTPSAYALTTQTSGSGQVICAIGSGTTYSTCPSSVAYGTVVKFQASPSAGSSFSSWSGGFCSGGSQYCTVTVTGNTSVTAAFSDTQAPTIPTNLNASAVSTSEIDLTWTASTDNVRVTGYEIYRNGSWFADTPNTSFNDTGLSTGTAYSYRVDAYDAALNASAQSSPAASATTFSNLSAGPGGSGTGTVSCLIGSASSYSACPSSVAYGTVVKFNQSASPGSSFSSWSGVSCNEGQYGAICTATITSNSTVSANFTANSYTLSAGPGGSGTGTVSCLIGSASSYSTCPSSVAYGTVVKFNESASPGSSFSSWSGATCNEGQYGAICTATITSNSTVSANFTANSYTLSAGPGGSGTGTVSCLIGSASSYSACPSSVAYGTVVKFNESASPGSSFSSWSGATCNEGQYGAICTATITSNSTVSANFTANSYTLSAGPGGSGTGTVSCLIGSASSYSACPSSVAYGTVVKFNQSASPGSSFSSWSGATCNEGQYGAICTATITSNSTVSANFTANSYTLSAGPGGSGTGTVSCLIGSASSYSACPSSVAYGTVVKFNESASPGSSFSSWSGATCNEGQYGAICTATITSNSTVSANFTANSYTLSAGPGGSGTGTVSCLIGSASSYSACPSSVAYGTVVKFNQSASPGSSFSSWSGATCNEGQYGAICTATITSNSTVSANFTANSYTLSAGPGGSGTGTVSCLIGSASSYSACPSSVAYGTVVKFNQSASPGSSFSSWSGATCNEGQYGAICTATITSNSTVSANFTANSYTLSAGPGGSGTGTVSCLIGSASSYSACPSSVAYGTVVKFNESASPGSSFSSWSGATCNEGQYGAICTATITSNSTVSANFTANSYTLSAGPGGSGTGTVSCLIGSASSYSACPSSVAYGTVVKFNESASPGSSFSSWSGATCNEGQYGAICTATITSNSTVSANFTANSYTLSAGPGGSGTGTVSCLIGSASSYSACPSSVAYGTVVKFNESASPGSSFSSWSGATCNEGQYGAICTATITSNSTVSANFTANSYTLSAGPGGSGTGTVSCLIGSASSYSACPSSVAYGTVVKFNESASPGSSFSSWSGATCNEGQYGAICTATITSNSTVSANFTANSYTLSAGPGGSGTGTVSCLIGSASSYSACPSSVAYGTVVKFNESASPGSSFSSWSGATCNEGQYGAICTATITSNSTVTATFNDTQQPTVPAGLNASAVSTSEIDLYWTASTDNIRVTGYDIYRNGSWIGTTPTNGTTASPYKDTGLSAGTAFSYKVDAYDAVGNVSAQSGSAAATTAPSATPTPTPTSSNPPPPPPPTITSPSTNTTYTTAQTVTIAASASAPEGISKVEFYEDGNIVETDTTSPYQYSWSFSAANNGSHSFVAEAYSTAGGNANSQAVVITVNVPQPSPSATPSSSPSPTPTPSSSPTPTPTPTPSSSPSPTPTPSSSPTPTPTPTPSSSPSPTPTPSSSPTPTPTPTPTPLPLGPGLIHGFVWSSNIGWISLSSSTPDSEGGYYNLSVETNGDINGYAWSSNIGWIQFGHGLGGAELSGFPDNGTTQTNANLSTSTYKVTGWARACAGTYDGMCANMTSRTDGWDGWIELSGAQHVSPDTTGKGGVTYIPGYHATDPGTLVGYAWGGNVVGWIQFDQGVPPSVPPSPCPSGASPCPTTTPTTSPSCPNDTPCYTNSPGYSPTPVTGQCSRTPNNISEVESTGDPNNNFTLTVNASGGAGGYTYYWHQTDQDPAVNQSPVYGPYEYSLSGSDNSETFYPSVIVKDSLGASSGQIWCGNPITVTQNTDLQLYIGSNSGTAAQNWQTSYSVRSGTDFGLSWKNTLPISNVSGYQCNPPLITSSLGDGSGNANWNNWTGNINLHKTGDNVNTSGTQNNLTTSGITDKGPYTFEIYCKYYDDTGNWDSTGKNDVTQSATLKITSASETEI